MGSDNVLLLTERFISGVLSTCCSVLGRFQLAASVLAVEYYLLVCFVFLYCRADDGLDS